MRILTWLVRLTLFILVLAFAVKNTDRVTLRFYFDLAWQAPLIIVLLATFAAGTAVGVIAIFAKVVRQKREILRLKRDAFNQFTPGQQADATRTQPALPPVVDA